MYVLEASLISEVPTTTCRTYFPVSLISVHIIIFILSSLLYI